MDVAVLDRQRGRKVRAAPLARFLRELAEAVPAGKADRLGVCLVSDRGMRQLNLRHRGRDATTDVLAFPAGARVDPEGGRHLGDIAISVPAAARQAKDAGHSLSTEIRILLIHGYLHLLGHDHERDGGQMARLEHRLARRLLRERAGSPR